MSAPALLTFADAAYNAGRIVGIIVLVLLVIAIVRRVATSSVRDGLAESQQAAAEGRPTKQCPDCAETILADASLCKHCGYRFAAPTTPGPRSDT